MTNKTNNVIYTGVTSQLKRRINEHRNHYYPNSFTSKYNVTKLVYYKGYHFIEEAIAEEKRIKGGSRSKKEQLITGQNPQWLDLYKHIPDDE